MNKKIRIWKLGDHKEGILPDKQAIEKLINIIESLEIADENTVDLVWDSMLNLQVYENGKVSDTSDEFTIISIKDLNTLKETAEKYINLNK